MNVKRTKARKAMAVSSLRADLTQVTKDLGMLIDRLDKRTTAIELHGAAVSVDRLLRKTQQLDQRIDDLERVLNFRRRDYGQAIEEDSGGSEK